MNHEIQPPLTRFSHPIQPNNPISGPHFTQPNRHSQRKGRKCKPEKERKESRKERLSDVRLVVAGNELAWRQVTAGWGAGGGGGGKRERGGWGEGKERRKEKKKKEKKKKGGGKAGSGGKKKNKNDFFDFFFLLLLIINIINYFNG